MSRLANTAESLKRPNFLAFLLLASNIVVSVTTLFLPKMGVDGPILLTQSISITAATRPQLPGGPGLPKNCPIFPAFRLWPPAWGEGDKTQRQNCPHPSHNILTEKYDNGLTYKTLSSQIWRLFISLAFVSLRWWMIDPCFKKRFNNNVSDRLGRGERKTGPILEFEVLPWINLNLDLDLVAPTCQRQSTARWEAWVKAGEPQRFPIVCTLRLNRSGRLETLMLES